MMNFLRIFTLVGIVGSVINGDLSRWFLLALPAIYFLPEILLLLWWVVTLPVVLILTFFGVSLYSPLFLVSWITDKFKKTHKQN